MINTSTIAHEPAAPAAAIGHATLVAAAIRAHPFSDLNGHRLPMLLPLLLPRLLQETQMLASMLRMLYGPLGDH